MANDGVPVSLPASSPPTSTGTAAQAISPGGGNILPHTEGSAVTRGVEVPPRPTLKTDVQALVQQLNKYLNESGRPNLFRVDPASAERVIQEINPATGAVLGQFAASEFPALVKSLGLSGLLVDERV